MPKGKYRATIKGLVEAEKDLLALEKRYGQAEGVVRSEVGRTKLERLWLRGKNKLREARADEMVETPEYKSLMRRLDKYNRMSLFRGGEFHD